MPRYLTAGSAPYPGCQARSGLSYEKINRPLRWLFLQYYDYNTKAEADVIIQFCKDYGITDVAAFIMDYDTSPKKLYAYAGSCNDHGLTSLRFDTKFPADYLAYNLYDLGVKFHAVWPMHFPTYWGGATSYPNSPLDYTVHPEYRDQSNGGDVVAFGQSAVRTLIKDILWDLAHNNRKIHGVCLDYIRTDGAVTTTTLAHVTSMVQDVRNRLPDRELSFCCIGAYHNCYLSIRQDAMGWMANRYVNTAFFMAYWFPLGDKEELIAGMRPDLQGGRVILGLSAENYHSRPSDLAYHLNWYEKRGYRHVGYFDSGRWDVAGYRDVLEAMVHGSIENEASMGAITKITHTPGTSWTVTIGGSDKTTTYASVSDHTEGGYVKADVEAAHGEQPAVCIIRLASTTTYLTLGDFSRYQA